jgi:hypothetical protein
MGAAPAVDDDREGLPTVTTCPDAAQIGVPALIRRCHHQYQSLTTRTISDSCLADLPADQPEDSLNRSLVKAQSAGDGSITKGRLSLNQLFGRRSKSILNLWLRFNRLLVHRAAWNIEPTTERRHRNRETVVSQAPLDLKNHVSSLLAHPECPIFFGHATPTSPHLTLPAAFRAAIRTARGYLPVWPSGRFPSLTWLGQSGIHF